MQIRARHDRDLDELAAIAAEVHRADGYPVFLPDGDYRAFLQRPEPLGAWVAVDGNRIVGHIALNETTSPPVMQLVAAAEATRPAVFLARLLVDPDQRRRGVGRQLLDHARAEAAAMRRSLFLDVVDTPTAHPAIAMYRSAGWDQIGSVTFTLVDDEIDELVFRAPEPDTAFDLVIFDCDGVLVDSERLTVEVEARVLSEMGWPITADEIVHRFMGRSSEYALGEIERRLGPERTAEFDRVTTTEIVDAFRRELTAIAGVEQLIETLHDADVATCVASSGSHRKMQVTLGITDLYATFAGRIFSASEVDRAKPAPDLFLHAAGSMGVAPRRAAVIEDSVSGVEAARAAGMTCFGFAGGLSTRERLVSAGAIPFDQMSELVPQIVGAGT